MSIASQIKALDPCAPALLWLETLPEDVTPEEVWAQCPDGSWMLWLIAELRAPVDHRTLVLCACEIARTVLVHVPEGEDRPRLAIEAAEGWVRGEVTLDEVRRADDNADAAFAAAYAFSFAAASAVDAASAATNTANAFASAVDAASAASAATNTADIVRKHFPAPPALVTP